MNFLLRILISIILVLFINKLDAKKSIDISMDLIY